MNKQKIKEIVKFYIQKNIQNKWFILVNILILLSVLIATNGNNIKSYLESKNINLFTYMLCCSYFNVLSKVFKVCTYMAYLVNNCNVLF